MWWNIANWYLLCVCICQLILAAVVKPFIRLSGLSHFLIYGSSACLASAYLLRMMEMGMHIWQDSVY